MWKLTLTYSVLAFSVVVCGAHNKFISKGRWMVDRIERCANPEIYPYEFSLQKKKVNRTHDGFYGEIVLLEDLTENDFGISIEACIQVDGGCRRVAKFTDESLCRFFQYHSKENFNQFLRNIGVEERCPIPKGYYKLEGFLFDNREIADQGMVGEFMSTVYVTKHGVKEACFVVHVHFAELEEDEE